MPSRSSCIDLQLVGTNKFASQRGMTGMGTGRDVCREGVKVNILPADCEELPEEKIRLSDGIVRLQAGTNKYDSQKGMHLSITLFSSTSHAHVCDNSVNYRYDWFWYKPKRNNENARYEASGPVGGTAGSERTDTSDGYEQIRVSEGNDRIRYQQTRNNQNGRHQSPRLQPRNEHRRHHHPLPDGQQQIRVTERHDRLRTASLGGSPHFSTLLNCFLKVQYALYIRYTIGHSWPISEWIWPLCVVDSSECTQWRTVR